MIHKNGTFANAKRHVRKLFPNLDAVTRRTDEQEVIDGHDISGEDTAAWQLK